MAKFDLSRGLRGIQSVKDVAERASDSAKKAAGTVANSTKKVVKEAGINRDEADEKKRQKLDDFTEEAVQILSTESAIKIIYYLISVDGEIKESEIETFNEIGRSLDPKFNEYEDSLIDSCKKELNKVIDDEDYYDVLQDAVEDAILKSEPNQDAFITPKLLLWDLLTIAYSDNTYRKEERKLLKYLVRKLDVNKAVFLELESSMATIMDIEKEIEWIKTTNRPYLKIEAIVNELTDRKNVVFEAVKDLIAL